MAPFPSLRPRARSFSFGDYQVTNEATRSGSVRFLHGPSSTSHSVRLGFIDLTQGEARLIRNHYRVQDGGHIPFYLSALTWAGHSNANDLVPATTKWRYAGEPRETQKNGGFTDVVVDLIAVI